MINENFEGSYNIVFSKDKHQVTNRPIYFNITREEVQDWVKNGKLSPQLLEDFIRSMYKIRVATHFNSNIAPEDKSIDDFISWVKASNIIL